MIERELIVGVYHTSEIDTSDQDFEQIYQQVYLPLLTLLYEYPKVRTTLYIPGTLVQWFDKERPEVTMLLQELSKRRQIEFLSGGRYDPYLAILPPKDRVGQVELMTTLLRKQFKTRTRGIYLTGQVWTNSLIQSLASCGIDYTFIFDAPIQKFVGPIKRGALTPFRVEQDGKTVTIFPIHKTISQEIYSGNTNRVEELLIRNMTKQPISVLLDVKKLKEVDRLPDTFRELFQTITDSTMVKSILPREYLRNSTPARLAYLPEGWYDNSTDWKSPQDAIIHTPEATMLYGKMQYAHRLIGRPKQDKSRKKSATNLLYKAQNYALYAAGSQDTGLNSRFFRHFGYSTLIEVDKMLRGTKAVNKLSKVDLNHDGIEEYYFRGEQVNLHLDSIGGSISNFEYIPKPWNYGATYRATDSLRRSFVDYITPLSYQPKNLLVEDRLSGVTNLGSIRYQESEYERDSQKVKLSQEFSLQRESNPTITIQKEYRFTSSGGTVTYQLHNQSLQTKKFNLVVEFNFAFAHLDKHEVVSITPEVDKDDRVGGFLCNDLHNSASISVISQESGKLYHSQDDTPYQHTTIYLSWEIQLEPGESWSNPLGLTIENLLKSQKK